ncbi:MAG: hypothetical protein EON59_15860 [Alphaproteobacteria bacterium]|nr:MAG: hypothetical protein EON59_15860 [Alphaproteobacteria bacterium]
MKIASQLAAAALVSALFTAPAAAQEASGNVTITVNIPPFAAGLAAQAEGAVGLWTMVDDQSTLMVKLPGALEKGESAVEAAVFSAASTPFKLAVAGSSLELAASTRTASNGLIRHGFTLRTPGALPNGAPSGERISTLVIAAV